MAESREGLSDSARALADWLGSHQAGLLEVVDKLARRSAGGIRIRVHGDLHLGQVLVARATPSSSTSKASRPAAWTSAAPTTAR